MNWGVLNDKMWSLFCDLLTTKILIQLTQPGSIHYSVYIYIQLSYNPKMFHKNLLAVILVLATGLTNGAIFFEWHYLTDLSQSVIHIYTFKVKHWQVNFHKCHWHWLAGMALNVNVISSNEETNTTKSTDMVKDKLQRVLKDPKWVWKSEEILARFRDKKATPFERAACWVEWLIRDPDSDYSKSPVPNLGFIYGNAYDIVAIIFIICFRVVIGFNHVWPTFNLYD